MYPPYGVFPLRTGRTTFLLKAFFLMPYSGACEIAFHRESPLNMTGNSLCILFYRTTNKKKCKQFLLLEIVIIFVPK